MKKTVDSPQITIRRAVKADRKAVLEFCRFTFGSWGDFLPSVWNEWVTDTKGALFVAEMAGKPVGLSRITVHRPGEIWLEGLRVDPDVRGRGLSRLIHDFTWEQAKAMRPKTIRYATGSYNKISQHLGCSSGMEMVAWFDEFEARPVEKKPTDLVQAGMTDREALGRLFFRADRGQAWHGLHLEGWTAKTLDHATLEDLIRQKRVWMLRDAGAETIRAAGIVLLPKGYKPPTVCRVAYRRRSDLHELAAGLRAVFPAGNEQTIQLFLPHTPGYRQSIKGTAWKRAMKIWITVLEWTPSSGECPGIQKSRPRGRP